MVDIELMQLTTAEILQIDATIITGILILLTLARNTLTRSIPHETMSIKKTTMRLPTHVALVVVPFSISALSILLPLLISALGYPPSVIDSFTNMMYQFSLGMMIVGFLYIIAVIMSMTRQKLI